MPSKIYDENPVVSAIIPTIGKASLRTAVRSALDQTWSPLEVIVSIDGSERQVETSLLPSDPRVRIIATGSPLGPQVARGRGISVSKGAFIALLDDDDVWYPTKIERQMEIALRRLSSGAQHVIVACRTAVMDQSGRLVAIAPKRLPIPGESLGDYIFVRRRVIADTAIGSSMLLFDRSLASAVPLSSRLRIHEDWDWLLTAQTRASANIAFSPEVLLRYNQQTFGSSASSIATWSTSAEWFRMRKNELTARQIGDGLLGISAHLAVRRGDWKGVRQLVKSSFREGQPGPWSVLFLVLLILRRLVNPFVSFMALKRGTVPQDINQIDRDPSG